jgi:hypothetical protein
MNRCISGISSCSEDVARKTAAIRGKGVLAVIGLQEHQRNDISEGTRMRTRKISPSMIKVLEQSFNVLDVHWDDVRDTNDHTVLHIDIVDAMVGQRTGASPRRDRRGAGEQRFVYFEEVVTDMQQEVAVVKPESTMPAQRTDSMASHCRKQASPLIQYFTQPLYRIQ